jgi:hypothetical protein
MYHPRRIVPDGQPMGHGYDSGVLADGVQSGRGGLPRVDTGHSQRVR